MDKKMDKNVDKMAKKRLTKTPHWKCEFCKKKFVHQSGLSKHVTKKHNQEKMDKFIQNGKKMAKKRLTKSQKIWSCDYCEKTYKHQSSLCKHRNNCRVYLQILSEEERVQNLVMKKEIECKNEMIEILKTNKQQITNKNNNKYDNCYNTNNINNKININFYLNETCKNALNLTDFVKQIAVSLEDILKTKSLGYTEGVSEILIKNLNDLPQEDRPVQCSDLKPLEYYVKDDGEWSKNEISKMQSAIGKVTQKQAEQLKEWCKKNPNWNNTEDGIKEWRSIQKNIMGSSKENIMVVEKNTIIEKVCEQNKIKV